MKKIALFALIGIVLMGCQKANVNENQNVNMEQDLIINNMRTRVSVRAFTGEKISEEQIQTLLQCAMAAPSAMNHQPWAFIVVTEDSILEQLGHEFPYSRCDQKPACAIIPCGDLTKAIKGSEDFWINDVSAATENILLAAHAMGLGAVWTGLHPNMERATAAQQLLGLPEYIIPLCIVPVGVPAEQPEIKDKWNTDNIHYNRW
ncbi:MAG: nitroreductase family protein [Paludibacteraceae bacterium]|nr:nitroreductase family protein [Paludibacteraceae bacterium]